MKRTSMLLRGTLGLVLGAFLASSAPVFSASTSTDVIDGVSTSTALKAPVRGVTTTNITLSGLSAISTVEGSMTPADGDRFLLTGQTTASQNLIYVAHSTAWTVAVDSDGTRDLRDGTMVKTQGGVIYHLTTSDTIVPGTTSLTWVRIDTLASTGTVSNVATIAALKALTGLIDGQITNVASYYASAIPDGGGPFKWDSTSTATDNGGTVIAPDAGGTGRWRRALLRDVVNVKDFGAVGDGVTNDTSAWINALAALPSGGAEAAGDGGQIFFPRGTYLIDDLTPNKSQVSIFGSGMQTTIIKGRVAGSGATTGVLNINGVARARVSDLTLDGNGLKVTALGFHNISSGSAGLWEFSNVAFIGGTTDNIVIGNDTNNPDAANINFFNCAAQGGAFGSVSPSNSQIKVSGSSTLQINWFGGVIGGGPIAKTIKVTGGDFNVYESQLINSTEWAFEVSGGRVRIYGGHSEGTGGFLRTLSSDPQGIKSAPSSIIATNMVNTGANTSGVVIRHEAPRQLSVFNSFSNEDIVVNNASAVLNVGGNRFNLNNASTRDGKYTRESGTIMGQTLDGQVIPYGMKVLLGTSDTAVYGDQRKTIYRHEAVVLSASEVAGPLGTGMKALISEETGGGFAEVVYRAGQTPIITNHYLAVFVTAAPAAGEIQILNNNALGIKYRAGSSHNNTKVQASVWGL